MLILLMVLAFFLFEFAGYWVHRALHSPRSGALYRTHMRHHLEQYPSGSFSSPRYREPGGLGTPMMFTVLGAAIGVLMIWALPLAWGAALTIELAVIGWLNTRVHAHTHLERSWLSALPWGRRLRERHRRHHDSMGANFGVYTFFTDRIFGTYRTE